MAARPETSNGKPAVLVTGSTGLIGTRLVKRLAQRFRVVGCDVKPPDQEIGLDQHVDADLTDDADVRKSLEKIRGDYDGRLASVVHLAAYYDFTGEPSPMYQKLTVEGTRRLLRELQKFSQVGQFVFSSSLLVMQPVEPGELMTEDSPTDAQWEYPQSKLDAEQVIREEHGTIPYVVLRIAGVYDAQCHSLPIAQQMSRIYEKSLESHVFPGDRDHGQALVHLDDLVDCFARVVERRHQLRPEEMFLIAEPDVVSYGELQDRIGEVLHGEEWLTLRVPKAVARAGAYVKNKLAPEGEEEFIKPWMIALADDHYAVDISSARDKLGWKPQHRLRETVVEMARLLKRDPQRWYKINKLTPPEGR
ncbi:MAG: NAD-dependent epimerase/dehydratase family protein [Planctomycetaceae bacterium]